MANRDSTDPFIWTARAVAAAIMMMASATPGRAQAPQVLPFGVGERIEYDVKMNVVGTVGHGAMWIEGPVDMRGTQTLLLRSDFHARVGWVKGFDRSESWLDPQRMTTLRFDKHEHQPKSISDETVDVFPEERRWTGVAGDGGVSPAAASLDELSFIYYVRTLPLLADSVYDTATHFDAARNPVSARVIRRTTTRTGAGTFKTIVVEMRVTDPRRFKQQQGVITLFLTDDERRLPVRIESAAPMFGTAVFTMASYTPGAASAIVRVRP